MIKSSRSSDAFTQAVERALEHVSDVEWLGTQSALAAPYFIGGLLGDAPEGETSASRGRVLAQALREAAGSLPSEQLRLLNVSFFARKPSLNNLGVARELGMSEATYYRHRSSAIEAVAHAVNQRIVPPLRNALPRARPIVNREPVVAQSLSALQLRHSVAITGAGGLGKTTLGAHLAWQWPLNRVFWFTVRPGLNDHLSSFVFALGHFLRGQGAANTWRQLVADRGALDVPRILGLIRHDLGELQESPVLMCVDEADLLRQELRGHVQVIHMLEELSDSEALPLLLMGQQPITATQQHHVLSGLPAGDVSALLAREGVTNLSSHEHAQLCVMTRGNPALILLFAALCRAGDRATDVLAQLAHAPSVEVLLNRIWKRLENDERMLLMALSVFRSASPQDAWADQRNTLDKLIARDLAQPDGMGGVTLPAYIREYVLRRMTADQRNVLHLAAATVREAHGEYTSAAYHYIAGRQPALAVWTWFNHRDLETERGHAPLARELFKDVAQSDLDDDEDRRTLAILQAEQLLLTGAADEADEAIHAVSWPFAHPATPYARQLEGDALQMQGQVEQALEKYRMALDMLTTPAERRMVHLRTKIGYIYVSRLRDLDQARREGALALWQAHIFQGYVEEESGNYAAAQEQYETALGIASKLENTLLAQSRTYSYLGHLSWRQGNADTAIQYLERAIRDAHTLGETVSILYHQLNLASAYIVAGRYADALEQGRTALGVAESLRHTFLIAGLTACAAEACFYLSRLDEAEQYAMRSLHEEEEVHRPYALTVLGWVQHARGQLDQAEKTLLDAIQSAQETQDKFAEAPAWRALGNVRRDRGEVSTAREAYEQAQKLYAELNLAKEVEAVLALQAMLES